jgi:hypothetical protein
VDNLDYNVKTQGSELSTPQKYTSNQADKTKSQRTINSNVWSGKLKGLLFGRLKTFGDYSG